MSLDKTDPVELYTPARIAEFLLGNATSSEEYAAALAEVLRMGLGPDLIEHFPARPLRRQRLSVSRFTAALAPSLR